MPFQVIVFRLKLVSLIFSSQYQFKAEKLKVFTAVAAVLKQLKAMVISSATVFYFHRNGG